jgi:hypothetical protein
MDADDSGELKMALAEVDRLTKENESLRAIATIAMSELTGPQMGRVRARLALLDAGEGPDAVSR